VISLSHVTPPKPFIRLSSLSHNCYMPRPPILFYFISRKI
jgi:hypothetical protein